MKSIEPKYRLGPQFNKNVTRVKAVRRTDVVAIVGDASRVTLARGQHFRETNKAWQVCDDHGMIRSYPKDRGYSAEVKK